MSGWYYTCKKKKEMIVWDLLSLDYEYHPQPKVLTELI
jgi:hypothetical protein